MNHKQKRIKGVLCADSIKDRFNDKNDSLNDYYEWHKHQYDAIGAKWNEKDPIDKYIDRIKENKKHPMVQEINKLYKLYK